MARALVRAALKGLHIYGLAEATRSFRRRAPVYFVNFVFQRVVGLNRDVPWSVHFTSRVTGAGRLNVARDVQESFAVSGGCYVQATNGITIAGGTRFAPGVKIISANHDLSDLAAAVEAPPIVIGERCWLGANCVILPGVTLGPNTVVGAGAVVTRSVPGNCVVAGVPARVVRALDDGREAAQGRA